MAVPIIETIKYVVVINEEARESPVDAVKINFTIKGIPMVIKKSCQCFNRKNKFIFKDNRLYLIV